MDSRRDWLKKIGLGVAGLSICSYQTFAHSIPFDDVPSYADDTQIRLNANENPYGPSPLARAEMLKNINMNRYGREIIPRLRYAIAKKNNVYKDNILISAGSTEILDLVVKLAALEKGSFISAEPTFNYWGQMAEKIGLSKITVPLTSDKKHDLAAMLKAIQPDTKLIYVCNPNNPTGTICDHKELVSFINEASKKSLVLVDEAYLEFTDQESLSSLVKKNKNLIIAKTFSKIYGLAGARIGYAIANQETIKELSQLMTWRGGDVSTVSASGALASLNDTSFMTKVRSLNDQAKNYTIKELEKLNITCIPSYTNFIYFSLANYKNDYFEQLEQHDILGTRIYETDGEWSRITVGTMQEMESFIKALK